MTLECLNRIVALFEFRMNTADELWLSFELRMNIADEHWLIFEVVNNTSSTSSAICA